VGLLDRFRRARHPSPETSSPYREARESVDDILRELEAEQAALYRRVAVLERQIKALGQVPLETATGTELLEVVEILRILGGASGHLSKWNTMRFRHLARVVESLATIEH
jgi:hypothetical protein